ncbi:hypothetical protein OROMI_031496 [Orobanche minor]
MRALPLSCIFLYLSATVVFSDHKLGFSAEQKHIDNQNIEMATTLGGLCDSNSETGSLAQFAVDQHNTKENALLELVRVVKAQEQVVAGTLHHLTLEVVDAGKKKFYEAKVWVKPWMNFKELQEFKHVGDVDVPAFTSSDLGCKKEDYGFVWYGTFGNGETRWCSMERCGTLEGGMLCNLWRMGISDEQVTGWRSVPVHDPVVQEAAHHAVKKIQERSNSLLPYELSEIVHANAEVVETSAKFDMLLKVKRGEKEEKFKVEVHRNTEGGFQLNKSDQADH